MPGRLIEHTGEPMHHPWPADCFVQGGGSGVVFRREGEPYRTAFVEAFPGTFLRGEGKTIAEAEDACWAQYEVLVGCAHDQGFDRRQYDNGAGYCRSCGTWFGAKVTGFEPLASYWERSRRPRTLMERAFAGDDAAAGEVLGTIGRADQLPEAPDA